MGNGFLLMPAGIRHIEYVDVEDARDALDDTLSHIIEAEKELTEHIRGFEEEAAA